MKIQRRPNPVNNVTPTSPERIGDLAMVLDVSYDRPVSNGLDIHVHRDGSVTVYWGTVGLARSACGDTHVGMRSGAGGLMVQRDYEDEFRDAVGIGDGPEPFDGVSWRAILLYTDVIANLAAMLLPRFLHDIASVGDAVLGMVEEFERTHGEARAERMETLLWIADFLLLAWAEAGFPISEAEEW